MMRVGRIAIIYVKLDLRNFQWNIPVLFHSPSVVEIDLIHTHRRYFNFIIVSFYFEVCHVLMNKFSCINNT